MNKALYVTSPAASWPASTSRRGARHTRRSLTTSVTPAAMAVLPVALLLLTSAPPVHAVGAAAIVTAVQTAYETYQKFGGGQLTLDEATTQIVTAIETAKTEIVAPLDLIAAAEVRACASSAVIDVADIRALSQDTVQAFARDATNCATLAEAFIDAAEDQGALDQLGFAVNAVGPVALLARASAGLSTPLWQATLVTANTTYNCQRRTVTALRD